MLESITQPLQPSQNRDSKESFGQPEKFPGQKEMEKFSIAVTRSALIKNLTKEDQALPKDLEKYEQMLAVERPERLKNLYRINTIITDYQDLKFPSVLHKEVAVATKHFDSFKDSSKPQIDQLWLDYTPPNAYSKAEYSKITSFSQKEVALFQNAIMRRVENVGNEFGVVIPRYEILKNYAIYISQRHRPNLDQKTRNQNYIEDYEFLNLLNGSNNEVAIARQKLENDLNAPSYEKDESVGILSTPKQPESGVKTSRSTETKISRGGKIEEFYDLYRDSIFVDQLFEKIDYNDFLEKSSSKEEFVQNVKSEKNLIASRFIYETQKKLEKAGYQTKIAIKCYPSGYSDISIYTTKVDEKGNEQKSEVQIQTNQTVLNKEKETPENNVRKEIKDCIWNSNLELLENVFGKFEGENIKYQVEKLVDTIFVEMIGINNPSLEGFTLIIKKQISEVSPEFETQNQENYSALVNALAESMLGRLDEMEKSLARSQAWFSDGSFIQNKKDVDEMMSNIEKLAKEGAENEILQGTKVQNDDSQAIIKNQVAETMKKYDPRVKPIIELSAQTPFGEHLKPTARAIVYSDGKVLVLQKDDSSKFPKALEFPGGKIEKEDLMVDGKTIPLEEQNLQNLDYKKAAEQAAIRELLEETGQNSGEKYVGMTIDKVKVLGSSSYVNPKKDGIPTPTMVNWVFVKLANKPLGMQFGTIPEDNHNERYAKWVTVKELIAAQNTGFITIGNEILPLNGNLRFSLSDMWNLHKEAKDQEKDDADRRKNWRENNENYQRLQALKAS